MTRDRPWQGDDSLVWGITLEAGLAPGAALLALQRCALLPVGAEVVPGPDVDALELAGTPFTAPVRLGTRADTLVVAADHHRVDGLGLLGVLGVLLDAPVTSAARGLADRPSRPFVRAALARLTEAALAPTAVVAPTGVRVAGADLTTELRLDGAVGSAELVVASAAAVSSWNSDHGVPGRHVAVAVGASRRPGTTPTVEDASAYLRLTDVEELDLAGVREALRTAPAEPGADQVPTSPAVARVAAWAGRRLGSTLLVSHLGDVTAPGVGALAFRPVTGGRSGISLGAVTLEDRTTLTLRARPGSHTPADLATLLDRVAAALPRR